MRTLVRFGLALALALIVHAVYFIAPTMHAQSSCVVQPSGAVAWYPGDGNANDIMRGNNGTSQGTVTFATGKVGQAFSFNGSSSIKVNASPTLNVGPWGGFTIDTWINPASIATPQPLVEWNNGANNGYGAHFWISVSAQGVQPGNLWANIIDTNGAAHSIQSANGLVTANTYQHVALTYDKASGIAKLFLNGAVVATQGLGNFTPQTSSDLYFANRPASTYFYTGALDEIGIFNRALSPADIQTIFNAGASGKCKATSVQFEFANYPSAQTSGTATVTVTRTGDTSGPSGVQYATTDGTAKAGKDYTTTSGTLNFLSGEQSKTISIPILNNATATADTSFQIALSNASSAALGATTSATLTVFKIVAGPGRILYDDAGLDSGFISTSNLDGSNSFQLTPYRYRRAQSEYPSVSRLTSMIAFQGCGSFADSLEENAPCGRIFVMNADGTGRRQVTTDAGLSAPANTPDTRPVISPDGTRIAFISARPPTHYGYDEVFVVNTDGTNLHPLTAHQNVPNVGESQAYSVVWSPDSQKLLVHARRIGDDDNSLYTYNLDGTGEALLRRGPFGTSMAFDWSPDGRTILYPNRGGPYGSTYGYVLLDALNPERSSYLSGAQLGAFCDGNGCALSGGAGSVRFSPDGQKIVYGLGDNGGEIRTINLDGTNRSTVRTFGAWQGARWWTPGAAIPKPDHLTLEPDPVVIFGTQKVKITPTLYDAQGNVIFHGVEYETAFGGSLLCDAQHRCTGDSTFPYITLNGIVYSASHSDSVATYAVCGSNGGVRTCLLVAFNTEALSLSTSTPTIRKSGADGPGVLAIKRTTRAGATFPSIIVQFVTGGPAVRDTDYYLTDSSGNRINGNAVSIPADQTSFGIKIVPIASPSTGDKDVTLTLKSDESNYSYVADGTAKSATVTIKDDHPEQSALALTSITPNKGGNGGSITANIYGANIKPSATVKLARSGQASVNGTNSTVAVNGSFITANFDLRGKALGAWDVVVTNLDNTTATLPAAFTVEANLPAKVWIDIIGRYTFRGGLTQTFYFAYGNSGNVDAAPTKLRVFIPAPLQVIGIPMLDIQGAGRGILPVVNTDEGGTSLEFVVPNVPANSSQYAPFQVNAPPELVHKNIELKASRATYDDLYNATNLIRVDSTLTVNREIIADGNNYAKTVTHVKNSSTTGDITSEITLQQVDGPSDPIINFTNDGKTVTLDVTTTVPTSFISVSPKTLQAGTPQPPDTPPPPPPPSGWTKVQHFTHMAPEVYLAMKQAGEVMETYEKDVEFKEIADCLFKDGRISQAQHDAIVRASDGRLSFRIAVAAGEGAGFALKATPAKVLHQLAIQSIELVDTYGLARAQTNSLVNSICDQEGLVGEGKNFANGGKYAVICFGIRNNNTDTAKSDELKEELLRRLVIDCFKSEHEEITKDLNVVISADPNAKDGPQGGGTQHFTTGQEPLRYVISFENIPAATAPAQTIVITDQLDVSKVDLTTLSFGAVGFSSYGTALLPGLSSYSADLDLRPTKNLVARVNAQLDKNTGLLTWRFSSIDPSTGQPTTDPLAGFLPPDKNAPEGQGGVTFSVMPKAGLATGTEIRNKARIIFDANAPIDTPEYLNTIDNSAPASHVQPLTATQNSVIFNVAWSGTDTGSGISTYDVYVAQNGGQFALWQIATTATSAMFVGKPATRYDFYSIAHDAAGNLENNKTAAETMATTTSAFSNSIDDPRFFVRQHYLDFLNREPDQSGWDFWTNEIASCPTNLQCIDVKRQNVSAAYFLSTEFQETGYLVYRIYKASYGNITGGPVPIRLSEFRPDTAAIGLGVIVNQGNWQQQLENNKQAFTLEFVQRSRFTAAFPTTMTPSQFVDALFANAGVTPSVTDRTNAINEFSGSPDTSNMTARSKALRDVAENSILNQREFNRAFVLMQYFGYLRRNPNDAPDNNFDGYNFWLNKLNQFNGNFVQAEMVRSFLLSTEYRQRFGP